MVHTFHGGIRKARAIFSRSGGIQTADICENILFCLPIPEGYSLNVSEKDSVLRGSVLAECDGCIPCLSPISGEITEISDTSVNILSNGKDELARPLPPLEGTLEKTEPSDLSERLRLCAVRSPLAPSGIYASCIASSKIASEKRIRLVVDCTSPTKYDAVNSALILKHTRELSGGIKILLRASCAVEAVIITDNSSLEIIRELEDICDGKAVRLKIAEAKYPMHHPKLLVNLAVGKELAPDKEPLHYGCVLADAEICVAAYEAAIHGKVQTSRFLSVTNEGKPECTEMPFGAPLSPLVKGSGCPFFATSPVPEELIEAENCNLFLDESISFVIPIQRKIKKKASPCIYCGECESACPMYLPVPRLVRALAAKRREIYKKYNFEVCINCGSCTGVCPSGIEIRELIKGGNGNEAV